MPLSPVKVETDIRSESVARLLTPFVAAIGYKQLRTRVEYLVGRMTDNPFTSSVLVPRHSLELNIFDIINFHRTYGDFPSLQRRGQINGIDLRCYAFIAMFARVYGCVNKRAQRILEGRVKHAMTGENDFFSLELEIESIKHMMHYGCTVYCHDLEQDGGFDFLATRDGLDFEVECKHISADKGQQIHDHDLLALTTYLREAFDFDSFRQWEEGRGILIHLTLSARLPRDVVKLKLIAGDIANTITSRGGIERNEWAVLCYPFDIQTSPYRSDDIPDLEKVRDHTEQMVDDSGGRILLSGKSGKVAIVLYISSRKPDKMGSEMYRTLKDGSTQFSGTRPAILMAGMQAFSSPAMRKVIATQYGNGFTGITGRLFSSPERRHLFAIHYVANMEYEIDGLNLNSKGTSYHFVNRENCDYSDPRLLLTRNKADV
jgi:hypothetical protein